MGRTNGEVECHDVLISPKIPEVKYKAIYYNICTNKLNWKLSINLNIILKRYCMFSLNMKLKKKKLH